MPFRDCLSIPLPAGTPRADSDPSRRPQGSLTPGDQIEPLVQKVFMIPVRLLDQLNREPHERSVSESELITEALGECLGKGAGGDWGRRGR